MQVVYTPDDGEKHEWVFKPGEMRSIEAEAVENATGMTADEWSAKILAGSAKARRCLLWILLRREDPRIQLSQVDYAMKELFVDYDDEEAERLRLVLEADPDIEPAQREMLTEALDRRRQDPGKDSVSPASEGDTSQPASTKTTTPRKRAASSRKGTARAAAPGSGT